MRHYPEDDYDLEEAQRIQAEPWMLECLKLNPEYVSWGPHEDYMWTKDDAGWSSRVLKGTWQDGRLDLDCFNEVVNFYFFVNRSSEPCEHCDKSGYNPPTKQIHDDFYDFDGTGRRWRDKIMQDEVQALADKGRLMDYTHTFIPGEGWKPREDGYVPTAEEINAANRPGAPGFGHDAINCGILIKARATRLGVYGLCEHCDGHGYIYTEPAAKLGLTLWVIHPRKGASRGWEIADIKQEELPEVYAFLREAARRNAERFAKIPDGSPVAA